MDDDEVSDEPLQVLLPGRRSLLVRLTCQEGTRPLMLDVLNTYADNLEEEPGTEMFVVSLDPDDEHIVWLYEIFKDLAAEEAHRSSAGFARMMSVMPEYLDGSPAVLRMDPLRMALQETVLSEDWAF
jgi:quinol monooxygenase YgiN